MSWWRTISISVVLLGLLSSAGAFTSSTSTSRRKIVGPFMASNDGVAGSFFNPIPENNDDDKEENSPEASSSSDSSGDAFDFDESVQELIRQRRAPPKASTPSTINGVPTKAIGFGKPQKGSKPPAQKKPFVSLGVPDKPVNDISNPEYDDQGYTVYTNEETGEKKRVFEALVEYPCDFTMKIVGANEGSFVTDVVQVVAESCEVSSKTVSYTTRVMGKWTSVTVKAPVKSAEMLYVLYENIDRDPRVKFKF